MYIYINSVRKSIGSRAEERRTTGPCYENSVHFYRFYNTEKCITHVCAVMYRLRTSDWLLKLDLHNSAVPKKPVTKQVTTH